MVRRAERVRNHVPIRPPEKRNHLAETILRGNALRLTSAPVGTLHLVVSRRVARVTLVKSASFSMLTSLLSARGDPGRRNRNQMQAQLLKRAGSIKRFVAVADRLGGRRRH